MEILAALAVIVALWVVETAIMLTGKLALIAPATTVTEAGATTATLLLAKFTMYPPLAAGAVKVAVQVSVPEPVMDEPVHESAERAAGEVPDAEAARNATICIIHGSAVLRVAAAV